MATKEEYIDVLGQMEELYYNNDNCTLAMNLFKEDINLLTGLVNEHFEEKAETNAEHYLNDLLKVGNRFTFMNGKIENCNSVMCSKCVFNGDCGVKRFKWLSSSYVKSSYKLNRFEFDLIQTYRDCHESCKFSEFKQLIELKDKGYFKNIDLDLTIHEILDNCEVIQ